MPKVRSVILPYRYELADGFTEVRQRVAYSVDYLMLSTREMNPAPHVDKATHVERRAALAIGPPAKKTTKPYVAGLSLRRQHRRCQPPLEVQDLHEVLGGVLVVIR